MENNTIEKQILRFLLNDHLSINKDRKTIEQFLSEHGLSYEDVNPAAYFIRTSSPDVFAVGRKICETVIYYPDKKIWVENRGPQSRYETECFKIWQANWPLIPCACGMPKRSGWQCAYCKDKHDAEATNEP